jgi:hypothetical protein
MKTDNEILSESPAPATWEEMVRLEPRLVGIMNQARREAHLHRNVWLTYERLKKPLRGLVGSQAARPELRTAEVYELAHRHLADCLEACA